MLPILTGCLSVRQNGLLGGTIPDRLNFRSRTLRRVLGAGGRQRRSVPGGHAADAPPQGALAPSSELELRTPGDLGGPGGVRNQNFRLACVGFPSVRPIAFPPFVPVRENTYPCAVIWCQIRIRGTLRYGGRTHTRVSSSSVPACRGSSRAATGRPEVRRVAEPSFL